MTRTKRTCSVDGCTRRYAKAGLCRPHYRRATGEIPADQPVRSFAPGANCSIEGCPRVAEKRGWCSPHYQRWVKTGNPVVPTRPCATCGDIIAFGNADRKYCSRPCIPHTYVYTDSDRQKRREQREANLEAFRARERAWSHSERQRARKREYMSRPEQRKKQREAMKRWRIKNPGKWRSQSAQRRAARRGYKLISEPATTAYLHERDGGRCGICRKLVNLKLCWPDLMSASVDHIVPLSISFDDTRANKQLAHLRCNSRKKDRAANDQLRLLG